MTKKTLFFYLIIFLVMNTAAFLFALFINRPPLKPAKKTDGANTTAAKINKVDVKEALPPLISLSVPYVSEAPEGDFSGPWKNACEEAGITMVENYYLKNVSPSLNETKKFMLKLFEAEDKMYGENANSDAERTAELINDYASYGAAIKENPTVEEIKKELWQKRPVITFNRGFDLQNKNIPFLPTGSSYHSLVIVGYDETAKEFIVNDSGDAVDGLNHRYGYNLLMNSLHDYNYLTSKADGPSRVLFTYPK